MSNIFSATYWPSSPPDPFVAGDYFAFKRGDLTSSYPIEDYSIKWSASLFGSGSASTSANQISLDAVESGSEYQIAAGHTVTKDWTAGDYSWGLFVTDTADAQKRQRVTYGTFKVLSNWVVSTEDPRSEARKNLDLIEDVLYNRVQGDISSYSIAGRSLSKISPDELITMRDFYKRQVVMETRAERVRLNKGTGSNILGDFRR